MNNFYQNTGTYCVKLVFISEEKNLDFLKKDDFNIDKDKKKKKKITPPQKQKPKTTSPPKQRKTNPQPNQTPKNLWVKKEKKILKYKCLFQKILFCNELGLLAKDLGSPAMWIDLCEERLSRLNPKTTSVSRLTAGPGRLVECGQHER